jgi:hypothetical protein
VVDNDLSWRGALLLLIVVAGILGSLALMIR